MLYERVDWAWMLAGGDTLCHGWRPEHGFLPYRWEGYDEALILYLLALGSPTHPIAPASYDAWCRSYEWKTIYGFELPLRRPALHAPALAHLVRLSRHPRPVHARARLRLLREQPPGDPRAAAVRDPQPARLQACRRDAAGASPRATGRAGRREAIDGVERVFFDYVARGVPFGPDDGTLAPWAVAASLPFAPEIVVPTLAQHAARCTSTCATRTASRPRSTRASARDGDDGIGWVSPYHFGINEGPTVLMIENHRIA